MTYDAMFLFSIGVDVSVTTETCGGASHGKCVLEGLIREQAIKKAYMSMSCTQAGEHTIRAKPRLRRQSTLCDSSIVIHPPLFVYVTKGPSCRIRRHHTGPGTQPPHHPSALTLILAFLSSILHLKFLTFTTCALERSPKRSGRRVYPTWLSQRSRAPNSRPAVT